MEGGAGTRPEERVDQGEEDVWWAEEEEEEGRCEEDEGEQQRSGGREGLHVVESLMVQISYRDGVELELELVRMRMRMVAELKSYGVEEVFIYLLSTMGGYLQ